MATVFLWDGSISRFCIVVYQSMARIIRVASYSACISSSSANGKLRKVAARRVCYNVNLRNPIRHSYGKFFCSEYRTHDFAPIRLRIDRSLARVKLTPNNQAIRNRRVINAQMRRKKGCCGSRCQATATFGDLYS